MFFSVGQRGRPEFSEGPKGGGGCSVTRGQNFFPKAKGGIRIFPRQQIEGPEFFAYAEGGPEKIGDQPSQTDAPPLPPGKK